MGQLSKTCFTDCMGQSFLTILVIHIGQCFFRLQFDQDPAGLMVFGTTNNTLKDILHPHMQVSAMLAKCNVTVCKM